MSGLTPAPVCPQNEPHRDRPDSGSSSDGDDPPLRRPREAGFIAWPLAALLLCIVVGVRTVSLKLTALRHNGRDGAVLKTEAMPVPLTKSIDVPDVSIEHQKHVIGAGDHIEGYVRQSREWKARIIKLIHPEKALTLRERLALHVQWVFSIIGRFDHLCSEMELNLGLDQPYWCSSNITETESYIGRMLRRQFGIGQKIPKLDFIHDDRAALKIPISAPLLNCDIGQRAGYKKQQNREDRLDDGAVYKGFLIFFVALVGGLGSSWCLVLIGALLISDGRRGLGASLIVIGILCAAASPWYLVWGWTW